MKQISILLSFLAMCFYLNAQTTLPSNVKVQKPNYIVYQSNNDNSKWMDRIKKGDYGEQRGLWEVYSDKEGNQTYRSPQEVIPFKKLYYGQKLIIADIQNGFALVYEPGKYGQNGTAVNGESMGWIKLDNLLLWDKCPMDDNKVFKKAVVLLNLDANTKGDMSPDFLSNPFTKEKTGKAANKLEFYFIMKTTIVNGEVFYLLSKDWTIDAIGGINNLYGWIGEGNVSSWDNRLCFEPNWDRRAVDVYNESGIKPMVVKTIEDAQLYRKIGIVDINKVYWVDEEFTAKRKDPQLIRLPLISGGHQLLKNIYRVASIGQFGSRTGQKEVKTISNEERGRIERELQKLIIAKNNVNIIFVVDGTVSMEKFFKPIADAIDRSMKKGINNSFKFGAVVYRDYSDGDKMIEKIPLVANYERVSNFLNNCEAKQPNGSDKDLEEAMFNGIENALNFLDNKEDESNFIFLVGDCGNHSPDIQGKDINNIIKDMIEKRVNILAFQANNADNIAYNHFILQAKQIITKTVDGITKKAGSNGTVEMKLNSKGLYKTERNGNIKEQSPIVAAYTFCNPNERKDPVNLESLIEEMITEYDGYVANRINDIQDFLAGSSSSSNAIGSIPLAVREEFKIRWGWTDDKIDAMRGEVQLKIAGFTSDFPGNKRYEMFLPVLFISHEEYIELKKDLSKLRSNEFVNSRTAYYEALKSLAKTFFGNLIGVEQIEIETLMAQIYGVPTKFKPGSLSGIKIVDILEPARVSQEKLEEYIDNFNSKFPRFERIQNDNSYIFLSNGQKYYWIPINELP